MSPVHVIVGEDQRAEAMWATAFTGAVDLYRFDRNVDAFERLTAAEAPIDLVVLTPAQRGPFNLTADQFIARVLEGPLGASRCLANLHVIVVGQSITRSHPRVMSVSTLDAAIRLVKFGEIEHAPRPEAPRLPDAHAPVRPSSHDAVASVLEDLPFSGSVISRIWDAPDPAREAPAQAPAPARQNVQDVPPATPDVMGGGPVPTTLPATGFADPNEQAPAPAQLFARTAPGGFMVPPTNAPGQLAPHMAPVMGGGEAAPIGAPGESIEVATGPLQPVRQYQLPQAGYRGPANRGGNVHGAIHDGGGQPVPPALASQVQSMVYGGMHVGNPNDPLLTWSSGARDQAPMVPSVAPSMAAQPAPAPAQLQQAPMPMPMQQAPMHHAPIAQPQQLPAHAQPATPAVRVVPMDPPAGVYSPAPAPVSSDPFLARAEQGGGDVAFG
jgi:hypothetical protein